MLDLAHGNHVERSLESPGDSGGDLHSTTSKADHDYIPDPLIFERSRKLTAGVEAVTKERPVE
jgi:hypothetical protein